MAGALAHGWVEAGAVGVAGVVQVGVAGAVRVGVDTAAGLAGPRGWVLRLLERPRHLWPVAVPDILVAAWAGEDRLVLAVV